VIRRRSTGSFGPHVELLETFAGQSALAIVNARLFGELQTKTSELEIASHHKSEFLASMSHELRTPLNAVIGFSEVLLDRMFGEINERQDEYLRDIWNSGRHLLEILNEILDLSKVEAGQMVLEPSTFSVSSAFEYCLTTVRERATSHAITVTVDVADEVGTIEADELRFKQVVVNLLSNAVKFTPDGGTVSLRAYRDGTDLMVTVTVTECWVARSRTMVRQYSSAPLTLNVLGSSTIWPASTFDRSRISLSSSSRCLPEFQMSRRYSSWRSLISPNIRSSSTSEKPITASSTAGP